MSEISLGDRVHSALQLVDRTADRAHQPDAYNQREQKSYWERARHQSFRAESLIRRVEDALSRAIAQTCRARAECAVDRSDGRPRALLGDHVRDRVSAGRGLLIFVTRSGAKRIERRPYLRRGQTEPVLVE